MSWMNITVDSCPYKSNGYGTAFIIGNPRAD